MSETKFTPGPWKHTEALPRLVEASVPLRRNGWKVPTTVCHLGEGNGWCKERKWNAFLIAAAPEMYEALKKLKECIEDYFGKNEREFLKCGDKDVDGFFAQQYIAACNALKKARGEE